MVLHYTHTKGKDNKLINIDGYDYKILQSYFVGFYFIVSTGQKKCLKQIRVVRYIGWFKFVIYKADF